MLSYISLKVHHCKLCLFFRIYQQSERICFVYAMKIQSGFSIVQPLFFIDDLENDNA